MAQDGSEFWLYLADGGSVHFTGGPWGYLATEVFDPHGLRTTLTYHPLNGQLQRVEQEGGRSLNITWDGGRIQRVESGGSAGTQAVVYNYDNGLLASVTYPDDPTPAQYTYLTLVPPAGFFDAGPLLATAKDPHFEGPMTFISYTYRGAGCLPTEQPQPGFEPYPNARFDYYYASPTAIAEERSGTTGEVVSSFSIGCFNGTRAESNGFDGVRKFFYGHSATWSGSGSLGYQLAKVTDYTNGDPLAPGVPFERQSNLNGHPYEVWDGRGIQTRLTHGDGSGLPSEVRHIGSDGSFYAYNRVNPGNSLSRDPDRVRNPYNHWLFSKTDERYQTTTYTRDERRRVTRIDHPDGSYETFAYNWFNQVYAHRLASGATRIYLYDGGVWPPPRGRLTHEYNDVDGIANATIYTYDALDRVETISHPWSRAKGALFSVKMTYNGRHQVVTEEYPATDGGSNPTKEYSYDANGNCNGIKTELGYWSTYTYDDYRRCTSYIEPLNAPDWNGTGTQASRRWDWIYDRWVNGIYHGASSHTSKEWRVQVEPAFNAAGERHATGRVHDLNNRLIEEETGWVQRPYPAALGDWYPGPEREAHSFSYDGDDQKGSVRACVQKV
jgi:YD repeat-containing protein